jgi:hypothetical protein
MTLLLSFLLAVLVALVLLMLRESTRAHRRRAWWSAFRDTERLLRSSGPGERRLGALKLRELSRTCVTGEDARMVRVLEKVYGAGGSAVDR